MAKAKLLRNERNELSDSAFVEIVIWHVAKPVRRSSHEYKYRLAFVVEDRCVLRYDNKAGKGDHIHRDDQEQPYVFTTLDRLIYDFQTDVSTWREENES